MNDRDRHSGAINALSACVGWLRCHADTLARMGAGKSIVEAVRDRADKIEAEVPTLGPEPEVQDDR